MATPRQRRPVRSRAAATFSSPACYLHEFETRDEQARPQRGVGVKRIYEAPDSADGYRVLIDRLWPRGISKKRAALDAWFTDLAPSTALRTWFHRDPQRFAEFARRYRAELRAHTPLLQRLRERARRQRVTLLYAARAARVNHATVLRTVLLRTRDNAAPRAAVRARSARRG
jgi:uncharacterized protein YeaO (DUF488 family)